MTGEEGLEIRAMDATEAGGRETLDRVVIDVVFEEHAVPERLAIMKDAEHVLLAIGARSEGLDAERTTMMLSMGSPSWTMMEPSSWAEWREQERSSRLASAGRSAKRRMLSMQELPARLKAQSWPSPAQTRLLLALDTSIVIVTHSVTKQAVSSECIQSVAMPMAYAMRCATNTE